MARLGIIIGIILFVVSVFSLFNVTHQVKNLQRDLKEMHRQLAYERETVHVLKAEWSYLNRPDRLSALAQEYLGMEAMSVAQVQMMDDSGYQYTVASGPMRKLASNAVPMFKPMN